MGNQDIKTRRNVLMLIFSVVLTVALISGATFAYWNWQGNEAQKTEIVFTATPDFSCAADGGGDITSDEVMIIPTTCTDSQHAIMREITITPTLLNDTKMIYMDFWLKINSLGTGLSNSDNFRYAITTSSNSCTDGVVVSGNFKGKTAGSQIPIFSKNYVNSISEKYYLYIWLDEAETSITTTKQSFDITLGGECTNTHKFIVPEGATYKTNVTDDHEFGMFGVCDDYSNAVVYSAGDVINFSPTLCDQYIYGDYIYVYNIRQDGCAELVDENLNGWSVFGYSESKSVYGEILSSINGKDVVSISELFSNCYGFGEYLVTAPVIPSTIKYMSRAFNGCENLTGTIEINANPIDYVDAFWFTTLPITLTGTSTMLDELAATANNGNVVVGN